MAEPTVIIWTDADRVRLVAEVLDRMGSAVRAVGIGGPRHAAVAQLAQDHHCPSCDDFRKLMVEGSAGFVLLATWRGVSRAELASGVDPGAVVLALEPPLTAALPAALPRLVPMPAFTAAAGWTAAADPADVLGEPQLIRFTSLGAKDDWSLLARLYDAWQTVVHLADLPETIDASLTGPLGQVPDDLRGLTGHLAAHARLPGRTENAAAVLELSDRVGPHRRSLHVIATEAQWHVDDLGYQLRRPDGHLLDEHRPARPAIGLADLITAQWQGLLGQGALRPAPDHAAILACCQATRLSAHTGQPESPLKLLEMEQLA